ncbi:ABC transporter ATP-binding protein [Nonlabens ponticola]|uniref:ABC transporter ATP-binding protein n=1 Tax=Nonlabens ponticola TaxID=2496866 RepID=A0A3S9MUW8_9FLAO|nr:ABC transporter ATP-binding protein [Nonlabens ponticola]AZQ42974.1 ABC transporter ATP-binding protein [Nonlabens ponticola]
MSSNNPIVEVQGLNLSFSTNHGSIQVLHDVSFDLHPNEILAIVGESGSGKSVTSKVLMGLLPEKITQIDCRKLEVQQNDIRDFKERDWSRFRGSVISMIFQEPMSSLNPTITCGQQVAEILKIHTSLNTLQRKTEVLELFEKVKLPEPEVTYKKYPHEISGGQMQRVMIAMAIACKPKILIADEPTTALDVTVQQEILMLLKELQADYGMSMIFISHDLGVVKSFADRILVMYQGRIVESETATNIFENAQHDYTKALINSRPDPEQRVKRLPTITDFLNDTVKSVYEDVSKRHERLSIMYDKAPVLTVENVVKDYLGNRNSVFGKRYMFRAVDHVSFELYPQESLGVVGESGCGKSTLGNMITGLRDATSGSIRYHGTDLSQLSQKDWRAYRKDIQIIFQDPFASLNPRIKIGEAIIEPMQIHGIGSNHKERKKMVEKLLEQVGLEASHYDRYPHEFSGGQRQRIGIARTVALQPKIIVCDESVSALDISVQAQVLNLLNELKELYDFSYLFISHDLAVIKYFCDRVIVMNKGKIEEIQEADALFAKPTSTYTRKLIDSILH